MVPTENIIAVIPKVSGPGDEYSLLYAKPKSSQNDDSNQFPYSFRFQTTTNLPQLLIENFKPAERCPWFLKSSSSSTEHTAHVIISTGSGTGLASVIWTHLVKLLLNFNGLTEGEHYTTHSTTSETSVAELTQNLILPQANKGIAQSILLLSGDGGIVDIVNALLSAETTESYKKPTITLLPFGTGNAMANSSGITGDGTLGLRTMMLGSAREVPLFRATFSPGARLLVNQGQDERPLEGVFEGKPVAHGAVVCSWGLHAGLVADSDTAEYRKYGAERFKMAAKEALLPSDGGLPHAYKGRVSIRRPNVKEWEEIRCDSNEHGYVLATLVSHLESNFNISPSSKLLDGKLRLVHFGQLSGQEAMEVMGKAYQGGKHVEDERVGYEEIEALRIEFDEDDGRWRRVCLDGKSILVEKTGWVEVWGGVGGVVELVSMER